MLMVGNGCWGLEECAAGPVAVVWERRVGHASEKAGMGRRSFDGAYNGLED